ncbi:MAG: hypothetical protein AAFR76_13110 [Planctomycetota bacterium]
MRHHDGHANEGVTLIDGHVHVRPTFDVSYVLSAAVANFDRLADDAASAHHVLMLAESTSEESFARLGGHDRPIGRWRFDGTDEPCVLHAERDDGRRLTIVNGRQWTCDDKLEVLTMASDARLDDGMPFEACIEAGLEAGAVVVIPWGFGKWTGTRRDRVLAAIEQFGDRLVLGDSAARPGGSDPVLSAGRNKGLAVLPGTDPLPIRRHVRRVGRYALRLPGTPPKTGRMPWLEAQIRSSQAGSRTIGSRDSTLGAVMTQVRLRLG